MVSLFSNNVFLIAVAVIVLLAVVLFVSYVKAPPSNAYIISGLSKEPRVLIGRGGFRIPFFERLDQVYLGQISVDIKTEESVPTKDFINVDVDAIAKIRVAPNPEGTRLAAKNFLNMTPYQISEQLKESLQGNMREIIGTLELKPLNNDRDGFSDQVMKKASPDMAKLGIEIISCNIQNVTDEEGAIKDLGADNLARIKKDAAINRAIAERDVAIETAKADKESNDARIDADTAIAVKKNDLALKEAELKILADTAKANADAAYEIQKQEKQKTINVKTVEADIEKTRQEQLLTKEKVEIKANELKAQIEKQADADKYKIEKTAEADLEQKKREAEAKKYAMMQEAEGILAKGEAEAKAIEMKGEAEAKAMDKKAEAYKKYNNAAIIQMMVGILPDVAKNVAEPISAIKELKVYSGSGSGETGGGVASVSGIVPVAIKQTFDVVEEATGVNLSEVMKAGTIEAKTTRNINIGGKAGEAVEGLVEGLQEGAAQE